MTLLTGLPVFLEIALITMPQGVPLLIPDLNADAKGEVTFLDEDDVDDLRNLRGISNLQRCRVCVRLAHRGLVRCKRHGMPGDELPSQSPKIGA
jgi:hypothetical protein